MIAPFFAADLCLRYLTRKLFEKRIIKSEKIFSQTRTDCRKSLIFIYFNYDFGRSENIFIVPTTPDNVTKLLVELTDGNTQVLELLLPIVYNELRSLANNYLRRERDDHTLQPTALVHEAYIKLVDQKNVQWQNRAHFFGVAANIMRRILVDHARKHNADKRGGEFSKEQLEEALVVVSDEKSFELLALDDALEQLAKVDPQKSRIVELRYFGGLSVEETAEVMGISEITVKRHWKMAKAWLYGQISRQ
jgi:RNA polymerase sigma factor (TIGR02999 family)